MIRPSPRYTTAPSASSAVTWRRVVGLGGAGGAVDHVVAPRRGARPRVVAALRVDARPPWSSDLDGTHPMCGHDPPNHRRSTTATVAPSARALWAAASPAGPAPMTTKSKLHGSRCRHRPARMACARAVRRAARCACLVEQDGRGDRDVEAVRDAEHRERDRRDAGRPVHASVRPVGLRAEDERDRPAEVRLACTATAPPTRAANTAMPALVEPGADRCAGARRDRQRRTSCPSEARIALGLNRSVRGSATIDGVRARGVGRSQHRAEVARLLDRPRATTTSGSGRRAGERSSDTSGMRTPRRSPRSARRTPSRSRTPAVTGTISRAAGPCAARPHGARLVERALHDEHLDRACPARERPRQLAHAVDERQAGLVTGAPVTQRRSRPSRAGSSGS